MITVALASLYTAAATPIPNQLLTSRSADSTLTIPDTLASTPSSFEALGLLPRDIDIPTEQDPGNPRDALELSHSWSTSTLDARDINALLGKRSPVGGKQEKAASGTVSAPVRFYRSLFGRPDRKAELGENLDRALREAATKQRQQTKSYDEMRTDFNQRKTIRWGSIPVPPKG